MATGQGTVRVHVHRYITGMGLFHGNILVVLSVLSYAYLFMNHLHSNADSTALNKYINALVHERLM